MATIPPELRRSTRLNASLRNACWIRYNGTEGIAKCYCCGLESVTRSNFDCGHVVSRAKGGLDTLQNLRPICGCCNSSSGVEHMRDFAIKNGLEGRIKVEVPEAAPSAVATASVDILPLPSEVEAKSSKIACQTCTKLFTPQTLAKYDGKNCYRCFRMQYSLLPQKLSLKKADPNDKDGHACGHCGGLNVVVVD